MHVSLQLTKELLGNILDMFVRHVMVHMSCVCVLKNQVKKVGSHCSNAVLSNDGNKVFSDRFVYKTSFVNRELFDTKYVPSLSFDIVLKRKNVVSNHVNVHSSEKRSDNRC